MLNSLESKKITLTTPRQAREEVKDSFHELEEKQQELKAEIKTIESYTIKLDEKYENLKTQFLSEAEKVEVLGDIEVAPLSQNIDVKNVSKRQREIDSKGYGYLKGLTRMTSDVENF